MEFEQILKNVGEFGKFQKLVLLFLAIVPLLQGYHSNGWNFMGGAHEHWCKVDELQNFTSYQQKYISIPYEGKSDENFESCEVFNLPWQNYSMEDYDTWNRSVRTGDAGVVECNQWTFDSSTFESTISSEVCLLNLINI